MTLYEINKIRKIDHGDVPSTENGSGSHIKIDLSKGNIAGTGGEVKTKLSLDDDYIPQSAAEYSQMQKEPPQDCPYPEEYSSADEYAAALNEVLDSYKQGIVPKQDEEEMSALAALEEALGSRKAPKKYFWYLLLQDNEDFEEKSRYKSTYRGGEKFNVWTGSYTDTDFDDILYGYINGNEIARERVEANDAAAGAKMIGADRGHLAEMSEEEIALFNYIYATQGADEAYAFIELLTEEKTPQNNVNENFAKERDDKAAREVSQRKGENDPSDQKQFAEYKRILGENMPNAEWAGWKEKSGCVQTGAKDIDVIARNKKKEDAAIPAYEKIRYANDIASIAAAAEMPESDIATIKNHVFFDLHLKYDGELALFDADYDIAVAWNRLADGTPEERDILLLKHELLESQLEKMYNLY